MQKNKISLLRSRRAGFTLIELLVVIAIIGLLSTLAVVSLNNARLKSRDAKRVADIKQIQTALELFYSENTKYPNTGSATLAVALAIGANADITDCAGSAACDTISNSGIAAVAGATVYMGMVPGDPSDPAAECGIAAGVTPCIYSYRTADNTTTNYCISFSLEGATGTLSAGTNSATPDGISSVACTI